MKNNKGFSLVELIVVIAIMAILVGVAVPVYSSYVEKAQKASDIQMVGEIKQALQVYYASNPTDFEGGYILLKPNDGQAEIVCNDPLMEKAMEDTFGKNWKAELSLSYSSWGNTGSALVSMVAGYEDDKFASISNSIFMDSNVSTESMLGTVGDLLVSASGAINPDTPKESTLATLARMGVDQATRDKLSAIYDQDTHPYSVFRTAVANSLVGCFSGKIDDAYSSGEDHRIEEVDKDGMVQLMCFVANAYAYQEAMKGTDKAAEAAEYYSAVNNAISKVENDGLEKCGLNVLVALAGGDKEGQAALEVVGQYQAWDMLLGVVPNGSSLYSNYLSNYGTANADSNATALKNMMGAVSVAASNAQDLTDPNLFGSDEIVDQINAYRYAVQLRETFGRLSVNNNEVVVLILNDGTTFATISNG